MRAYDQQTGKPIQSPREIEIERLIRRIRNSGLVFDEDEKKAQKAQDLIVRCKRRLESWWGAYSHWSNRNTLPSWVTQADFM